MAPVGATLEDVDPADSPESPFAAPASGEELVIHVENVNLAPGLWSQVEEGATIWSRSPCVKLVTGPCPDQAPCVRVRAHPRRVLKRIEPDGGWADTDGTFTGRDRDGVRTRGRISLNLTMFANTSSNGRLATISHELGHALGLVHRRDRSDVMNAVTGDKTDPTPDQVDLANLLVLYGSQD